MRKKRCAYLLGPFFVALLSSSNYAIADSERSLILIPNELNQPLDIEPFTAHKGNSQTPSVKVRRNDLYPVHDKEFKHEEKKDKKTIDEEILAMVPYSDQMKYMWNIVDGDINIYFEGLRADRGNKGLEYKTRTLPLIGEFETTEFEVEAGEDMELSFETSSLPFGSEIEGFNFKGSVGDDARVSARYTIQFD